MNWCNTLSVMVLLVAVLSCGNRERDLGGFSSEAPVQFESFDFSRQLPSCEGDTLHCASLRIYIPRAAGQNDSVTGRINEALSTYLRQALSVFGGEGAAIPQTTQLAAEQLFDEYRDMLARRPDYAMPWWQQVSGEILWQNDLVACVQLIHESYAGGAHPNVSTTFFNFDLQTGRSLALSDLLLDEERLREVAEKKFRETSSIEPGRSLQEAGFFWDGSFSLPGNFALRENGLQFHYNSYEGASYAQGSSSLFIPYSELEGILILSKIK